MKYPDWLANFGFVGERKALALLCLGFYTSLFTLFGLIMLGQLPEWAPCFLALGACYGIGFFALAAEWFWGRWFAGGLGYSGVTMAAMSLVATREVMPQLVVFGVMHGIITVCVMGGEMASHYEAREAWRKRFGLDEQGVLRVRRSVTRAATSLPGLIMFALAPREGAEMGALALLGLGSLGLLGLLRGRTWGVLALAGAALAGVQALLLDASRPLAHLGEISGFPVIAMPFHGGLTVQPVPPVAGPLLGLLGCALIVAAIEPFARPMLAWLRSPLYRHR